MIEGVVAIPAARRCSKRASSSHCTGCSRSRWSMRARRLVGVMDVELYTEELAETGEHSPAERDDVFQFIGVRLTLRAAGPTAPGVPRPVSVVAL